MGHFLTCLLKSYTMAPAQPALKLLNKSLKSLSLDHFWDIYLSIAQNAKYLAVVKTQCFKKRLTLSNWFVQIVDLFLTVRNFKRMHVFGGYMLQLG